jgi:hypothetical protein
LGSLAWDDTDLARRGAFTEDICGPDNYVEIVCENK